ncbi:hypothetical protein R1flu_010125 [Riccia fluitans]|uniref:Uncharacterized protein n=1 Tax=Riccia fluitans TaxID=41844 RepID=A0ABD1Z437_9MARC
MKEVKIPHLKNANKKKMEAWRLGGLFAVKWSQTYEDLMEELAGHPDKKVTVSKYEYHGKPRARPQMFEGRRQSKSGVFLEQVEGDFDFVLFYHMLNAVLAPVRPEHFQHNQLSFYHYTWVAINDPNAPTPDWGDAVEKTVSRQIKALGDYNEA